ncbi:uncharacterized protein LOC143022041 [Oratosquilla oratoria]|uniref:uncharacterized protein LOC143022041 n=1 Tax=Oratosquilla oratoria TaxID=337810 RepID=UPI003F765F92
MGSPLGVLFANMYMAHVEEKTFHHQSSPGIYARKSTHTDRLLDFGSDHPICHKKSVDKTLLNRAERVCFTEPSLKEERSRLSRIFRANGYPNQVVKRRTVPQRRETDRGETQPATTRISIPYVSEVSELAKRILNKNGVTIAHRPSNTLRGALTRVKDNESKLNRPGPVCNISCSDCTASYVRETGKQANTRLQEHQRAVNRKDQRSVVYKHTELHQHEFDWQGAKILYNDNRKGSRLFLDA